jgi:tRNA pseudouridine55 synthase
MVAPLKAAPSFSGPLPDGLLIIDKPEGPTSHDVVARLRRLLGERRIGHTGTLDPLATGVLPLLVGRATRLARFLSADDKRYRATIRLGFATTTYDREGEPVGVSADATAVGRDRLEAALDRFRGTFLQTPPLYSAKKIGGVSAHRLARRGASTEIEPARVTVRELTLLDVVGTDVHLELCCSAGFYVRSLAHDLGRTLACGGHLHSLRRLAAGPLTIEAAVPLAAVERRPETALERLQPMSALLDDWPFVQVVSPQSLEKVRAGAHLSRGDCATWTAASSGPTDVDAADVSVRVLDGTGALVALAAWAGGERTLLHPRVVLF